MDQQSDTCEALELISIHKHRLHELRKQAALFGPNVDPSVTIQIRDLERNITELEQKAERAVLPLGVPFAIVAGSVGVGLEHPLAVPRLHSPHLTTAVSAVVSGAQNTPILVQHEPALILDAPSIQPWVSRRTETVEALAVEAKKATWVAVNGNASRGKTLLCRLLAEKLGVAIKWVQFSGLTDAGASLLVERLCFALTNQPPPLHRDPWYRAACDVMGAGAVLVLDDLPDLTSSPQLASRLLPFVRACVEAKVLVLSSSLFRVPQRIADELAGRVIDLEAPPFTDRDAEEVLSAFGAPANIIQPIARLINVLARQHPTLLVAACRYLKSLNWNLGEKGLYGLFQGAYTTDIAAEVHRKLLATVPDPDTRRLLYRLSLVAGPFSWEDVDLLATPQPTIDGARERLRDVLDSWVEQQPDGQWIVSGLLTHIGRDNLPHSVKQACHVALADSIVARGTMNQHTAFLAITHYHHGGEFGKAGTILFMILAKAFEHAQAIREDLLLLLWTSIPLPIEMDLNVRLIVRGLHIALFDKLQKPIDFLLDDFNTLLAGASEREQFGAAGALSYIIMAIGRKHPMRAGPWLRQFLQLTAPSSVPGPGRQTNRRDERQKLELGEEFPLHMLIWLLAGELTTPLHIRDWFDTLQALPADVRGRAMAMDDGHLGSVIVVESLMRAELAKASSDRDWPAVIVALSEFAARARAMRCDVLWACFVRAEITVQAEFCRDIERAQATANQASQLASVDPVARFLIDGTIGRQLLFAKRYGDARFWLRRAVERRADAVFADERAKVLLATSHVFGLEDASLGVKYAIDATSVAESDAEMPAVERGRAWCERAVAELLASGAASAFPSWNHAGEYLFSTPESERTDTWKELMVLFAHVSGYLAIAAATGQPPTLTRDGEPYSPPVRGVFMTTNAARVSFFNALDEGVLWRVLAYYADAVGNAGISKKWKERAASIGKRDSQLALIAEAEREDLAKTLREGGYSAALAAGRRAGLAIVVFAADTEAGGLGTVNEAQMPAALARLNGIQKEGAEEFAMIIGLLPCVLSVATLAISSESEATVGEHAVQLAEACRTVAPESLTPGRWELMAELIERAYVHGCSLTQLTDWSKSLAEHQPDIFYLLVKLAACRRATPSEAAATMLSFLPRLCDYIPPGTAAHRELLMPFVVSYWTNKFEKQRFLFRRPTVVESQLTSAIAAPEDGRVRAVLRAIHSSFTFAGPMPESVRRWLYG